MKDAIRHFPIPPFVVLFDAFHSHSLPTSHHEAAASGEADTSSYHLLAPGNQ
jgi:hypothetical protein